MSGDWDDVPLGYKNPPPWTRFRKGQSGNPKGRPRKKAAAAAPVTDSAVDAALNKALRHKVKVNDVGGSQHLEMLEVVARAQANSAAKGNVIAQRDIIRQARELEARDHGHRQPLQSPLLRRITRPLTSRSNVLTLSRSLAACAAGPTRRLASSQH